MTETNNIINEAQTSPALVKKIGKTTYIVNVHFSETSKETVADKLKRLIASDAELRD